jgi:hypothetical protein
VAAVIAHYRVTVTKKTVEEVVHKQTHGLGGDSSTAKGRVA